MKAHLDFFQTLPTLKSREMNKERCSKPFILLFFSFKESTLPSMKREEKSRRVYLWQEDITIARKKEAQWDNGGDKWQFL